MKKDDLEAKKKRNKELWEEISPEELEKELFGNVFSDYLEQTRKGNAHPDVPIRIFYALKHFAEYPLETSRLINIRKIQMKTGLNDALLRRHIHNFVISGFISEHKSRTHLTGTKKETTYLVKPFAEWREDLFIDLNNHVMLLREIAKEKKSLGVKSE
jgi:hypothetical protein